MQGANGTEPQLPANYRFPKSKPRLTFEARASYDLLNRIFFNDQHKRKRGVLAVFALGAKCAVE
jgi:hypothetical protein